jgi:hypothetical protein
MTQGPALLFDGIDNGFEFVFPQDWLADQAIALAEQTERLKMLDPPRYCYCALHIITMPAHV